MNYYIETFKKYATFSGRARRAEYWYFSLFNIIIGGIIAGMDLLIGIIIGFSFMPIQLSSLYGLVIIIPIIAISVRRLHDIGKSGWMIFILFIPIIGWMIYLIFMVRDSALGTNKYGPNPKETNFNINNKFPKALIYILIILFILLSSLRIWHYFTVVKPIEDEVDDFINEKLSEYFYSQIEQELYKQNDINNKNISTNKQVISTDNWITYSNPAYAIEMRIPQDYSFYEYDDTTWFVSPELKSLYSKENPVEEAKVGQLSIKTYPIVEIEDYLTNTYTDTTFNTWVNKEIENYNIDQKEEINLNGKDGFKITYINELQDTDFFFEDIGFIYKITIYNLGKYNKKEEAEAIISTLKYK